MTIGERDELSSQNAPSGGRAASALALTRDPAVRDLLLEVAMELGVGVFCAASMSEALSKVGEERPGMLIVDLDDAGRRGQGALQVLRADARCADLPIAVVTSHNDQMLSVALDATVFFKPDLDGLAEHLARYLIGE